MSSPAGLQKPETDFLTRWMPCSSRAGVILNPSLDLARSLRSSSSNWAAQGVDDSFSAQFAPLPYSSSSSLSDDSLVPTEAGPPGTLDLQTGKASAMDPVTAPGPSAVMQGFTGEASMQPPGDLMLKLEQLKQWQQHMQEKLKAHQMEQLQQLLEEQQKLLCLVHVTQQAGADDSEASQLTEGDWADGTVLEVPPVSQRDTQPPLPTGSDVLGPPVPQRQPVPPLQWGSCFQRTAAALHPHPEEDEEEEEEDEEDKTLGAEMWSQNWSGELLVHNSREDDAEVEGDDSRCAPSPHNAERKREEVQQLQDRPIRPGIGGRSRTFEELLEEKLRMEEQRLKSGLQNQSPAVAEEVRANPKRPFLKRGEGLSRFTGGKASLPQRGGGREVLRPQPKPSAQQRAAESGSSEGWHRPPVQRKTAVLNREPCSERLAAPTDRGRPEPKPGPAQRPRAFTGPQRLNSAGPNSGRPKSETKQSQPPPSAKSQHALGGRAAGRGPDTAGQKLQTRAVGVEEEEEGGRSRRAVPGQDSCSWELSFQDRVERWDVERQRERVELGEFELLEQAAEELSFSSNSSFVMKVLEIDRQDSRGRQQHRGRLSSTPIKSPKPSPPKAGQDSDGTPDPAGSAPPACPPAAAMATTRADPVAGLSERDEEVASDPGSSDFEVAEDVEIEREALRQESPLPSSLCFPSSQAQYDKTSYQGKDRSGVVGVAQQVGEEGQRDDAGGFGNHDDSTLTEGQGRGFEDRLVFDDDDTWNDLEDGGNVEEGGDDNDGGGGITHDPPGAGSDRALRRKVATARGLESEPQGPEPPPTSQLMAKLFPSLKPKARPTPPPGPGATGPAAEPGAGPQSKLLRERLVELEIEIERFRSENAALAGQRQEREKTLETLRKERVEFERTKAEEMAKMEEFRREETRRLQKERKLFEKHASAARAIPDKREREEIQSLKLQLSSLQEELRRREARWSSTHSWLRQQVDAPSGRRTGPCGTRSKSTSPPGALKASQRLTASAKELPRVTSPPVRASQGSSTNSSRKSSSVPAPTVLTQEWAVPDHGHPITAQKSNSPTLTSRAGVSQTGSCEEEEEEEQEEEQSPKEITHPDGKVERVLRCGGRLIVFPNGTRKEVSSDGRSVKVTFFNGDVKQVMEDQRVIYYYAEAQTTHTTYPDGMEVLHFPNSQIEKHFPDGRKEITFPDRSVKNLGPNGEEESVFPDGTVIQVKPDGSKVIQFNSGQREIHTAEFKRREYPDGTVKTVYSDGRQETRYPTGRLRIKDKDGRIVSDTRT
ncbi:hypothetical protein AAFF_G00287860 [Aldrovandia affinis]|uniref:Centrosomal P4.1-associated protein n=1 Tax=Aldrovandia affinis TaxID=143900 RepID=A0AAD7SR64_9TELE|nr:hypothetical protein AAFF_G00287860 [Aldrovandia affinis]